MSGHSKWAQIKRQKGVADTKRGQVFTKIAKAITIAVRQGGGVTDPSANFKLRLAIEKGRSLNMPRDNIERAIERGKGKLGKGEGLDEVVYEGFAPGRVAFIAEAATDNRLRTTSEVKHFIEKNGGALGTPGSVSYQFETKGQITVGKDDFSSDDIFLAAADAGADEVEESENETLVYTRPEDLSRVKETLSSKGFRVTDFELTRKPVTTVPVTDSQTAQKVLGFLEKLEQQDDIQKVYANFDIPDTLITQHL